MPLETTRFDIQDHLKTEDDRLAYLEAAFEEGDAKFVAMALGNIAKAKGMSSVAIEAGITREALYKSLSDKGDPKLSTLLGVMKALGISIHVSTAAEVA